MQLTRSEKDELALKKERAEAIMTKQANALNAVDPKALAMIRRAAMPVTTIMEKNKKRIVRIPPVEGISRKERRAFAAKMRRNGGKV